MYAGYHLRTGQFTSANFRNLSILNAVKNPYKPMILAEITPLHLYCGSCKEGQN